MWHFDWLCLKKEIMILSVRCLCVKQNCVLCFAKSVLWNQKGGELVYGFADLVCGSSVWGSGLRNCVASKDFVYKQ